MPELTDEQAEALGKAAWDASNTYLVTTSNWPMNRPWEKASDRDRGEYIAIARAVAAARDAQRVRHSGGSPGD